MHILGGHVLPVVEWLLYFVVSTHWYSQSQPRNMYCTKHTYTHTHTHTRVCLPCY